MIKISNVKDLGPLIKTKRKLLRLSQQELADVCGVGRRFISELETGKKKRFEIGLILRVLKRLDYDIILKDRGQ